MKSTGKRSLLEAKVLGSLAAAGVRGGERIVVGLSGGPDSTALLAALSGLCAGTRYVLDACIVDHGMRPRQEVDGDLASARAVCGSLGADLHVRSVPPGECAARAREEGRSLEEVARSYRLRHLEELAAALGAGCVALGHTRDDVVETLLMRALQGSDAAGLKGIALRRGLFVRPLLTCGRSEILAYLAERRLPFRVDPSNSDLRFLRNRIRGEVVPVLRRAFPGFDEGLLATSRRLASQDSFLQAETARRLRWRQTGSGFAIPSREFFAEHSAVRACSLLGLYDFFRGPGSPRRLPYRFLLPVLGSPPPAPPLDLRGHGARLSGDGDALHWGRDIVTPRKKSYLILTGSDGTYPIRIAGALVVLERLDRAGAGAGHAEVRKSAVEPPLVLRSRRRGDRLLLEHGRKSVKELYNEWKVPEGERQVIPLLADRRGVVAVLGGAKGFPTRVRAGAAAQGESEGRIVIRFERDPGPRE